MNRDDKAFGMVMYGIVLITITFSILTGLILRNNFDNMIVIIMQILSPIPAIIGTMLIKKGST